MTLANPGMRYGGFFSYSKYDVLKQLPEKYVPKSAFFTVAPTSKEVKKEMNRLGLEYPVILKPDEGERGSGVEKIKNDQELDEYLLANSPNIILQEFIDAPNEFGVMYVKYPSQEKGKITSIVFKGELYVIGDGVSDLITLFKTHPRAQLYIDFLKEFYKDQLNMVIKKDEIFMLSKMGNHCRGAIFNDANYLIDKLDVSLFDSISESIEGFYFGRYDLKAKDENALINGDFKVMELNGVNSEPAHIYDPDNSLMRAYKDLFRHWWRIYKISKENKEQGYTETPFPTLVQSLMNK
ncbi:ATP-grasp domain-containing protein [Flammeovirga agarivorans]|uniref:D-alanine--D-alanine ligase n=1 Tax=Flammeovirga agarivorans TaxID=2726742 RepID=A0A7X8SMR7_9BACT|nr:D-alanine--D-alanine ligase [Flammeovirga agarivorans]NLR93075.1 D-alanine--D-alanine ligase [Flammeovirga agarivorans]